MTRTQNSLKNIKYSVVGQITVLIISFFARLVFVKTLNAEYLGLNGLFSNLISLLSLAELGIGSAIIYSMYEPLANNDTEKLRALMTLYKRAYITIGIIILILGTIFMPFLKLVIKEIPNVDNIYYIYFIYVLTTAVSYFYSYKRSLIVADQKKYIDSFYHYSFLVYLNVFQIIVLLKTKNFILFLLLKLVFTLIENYLVSRKVNRLYPFINQKTSIKLNEDDKSIIIRNVKAMFVHRVGGVVVLGTDSLLLSKFVGVISVGLYSNYLLITNALKMLIGIIFQSLTASVGNLGVTENSDKVNNVFDFVDFLGFWIYGFSSIALTILFNPFISLWLGEEYLFPQWIVLLIVINFYLQGQRSSVLMFRDAFGLFWYDRYKPIFESIVKLGASVILAIRFGVSGVLLGTIISTLFTVAWIEPFVLHKYGLKKPARNYFRRYFIRILVVILFGYITMIISNIFNNGTLYNFLIKSIICLLIPNILIIITFHKTDDYKYLTRFLKKNILVKFMKR